LHIQKKTSSNFPLLDVFRRGEKPFFTFFVIGNCSAATLIQNRNFLIVIYQYACSAEKFGGWGKLWVDFALGL
jgi:hypothetical protein